MLKAWRRSRKSAGLRDHLRTTGLYSGSSLGPEEKDGEADEDECVEEEEELECMDAEEAGAGRRSVPPWTSENSEALMSGCFIIYDAQEATQDMTAKIVG